MQSPPFPRYLVPPRSKYSPQHLVLKHPQLTFLSQSQRLSFTPIQNNRQNYTGDKGYRHTLRMFNSSAFTRRQWWHEPVSLLRYTYSACVLYLEMRLIYLEWLICWSTAASHTRHTRTALLLVSVLWRHPFPVSRSLVKLSAPIGMVSNCSHTNAVQWNSYFKRRSVSRCQGHIWGKLNPWSSVHLEKLKSRRIPRALRKP